MILFNAPALCNNTLYTINSALALAWNGMIQA